jgi:hypothetical protein
MSLVGSASSTLMGFIFPSLVILATERKLKWTHAVKRTLAVAVALLGTFLFINGFAVLFTTTPE